MSLVFNGCVSFFATVFLPVYRFIQPRLSALFSIVFLHLRHFMKHSKPDKSSDELPRLLVLINCHMSLQLFPLNWTAVVPVRFTVTRWHQVDLLSLKLEDTLATKEYCVLWAILHINFFLSNFIFSTYWCCTIATIHLEKVFNHFHHNRLICFLGYMQCVSFLIKQICFS